VRAWDESNNVQPGNLTWNVLGMMNNVWFKVKLVADHAKSGGLALRFVHPATIENGGWMVDEKAKEAGAAAAAAPPAVPSNVNTPKFTLAEVQAHTTEDDCWVIIKGKVYDCTNWLSVCDPLSSPQTRHRS